MTVPPKMDLTCDVRRHVKVLSRRKCNFSDAVFNPSQFVDIFPDPQLTSLFTIARSKEIGVQCQACDVSALNVSQLHLNLSIALNRKTYWKIQINTDCATTEAHGVFHKEGGWPRDVNPQEADQTARRSLPQKDREGLSLFPYCSTTWTC
jgi:dynein intermediate chain 2